MLVVSPTMPMTVDEATNCLNAIEAKTNDLKELVYDLWSRKGYEALGYTSFNECVTARFGASKASTYYRLKDFANFERNVLPSGESIKSASVREFTKLKDDGDKFEAWEKAKMLAQSEGKDAITQSHAKRAVALVQQAKQVEGSSFHVVTSMFTSGELSQQEAQRFTELLSKASPTEQGYIQELMARFDLRNSQLVEPIIAMMKRKGTERESLVLPEVERGFLGGVALKNANITDLKRANEEARLEHLAKLREEERASNPSVEPVIVTVWLGDAKRTLNELRKALGEGGISQLRDALLSE